MPRKKKERVEHTVWIPVTMELFAEVCDLVAEGMSLVDACQIEGMPTRKSCYEFMKLHAESRDMYARAREHRAEVLAEEIITIADEAMDPVKGRLRVDARKWAAAKLDAKRYGDKTEHLHGATDTLSAFLNTIGKGPVFPKDENGGEEEAGD